MVPSTTPSSSMAIVQDKRPAHRPGGCVGIFFQLFDWNRRFAKKKLFPKKLLPPGTLGSIFSVLLCSSHCCFFFGFDRLIFFSSLLFVVRPTKRVSKKFGGDEKMPMAKFLLV